MKWSDVVDYAKEAVGAGAPVLGGMLAGRAGATAGRLLASALGVENDPQAVADAIQTDPNAALKIRQVEAELEQTRLEVRGAAVQAEASGESWLQRNWRPLMMLWFGVLVGGYWFGFTPPNMPESTVNALFDIVQIGIGGYIVGRSAEKITRTASGTGLLDRIRR